MEHGFISHGICERFSWIHKLCDIKIMVDNIDLRGKKTYNIPDINPIVNLPIHKNTNYQQMMNENYNLIVNHLPLESLTDVSIIQSVDRLFSNNAWLKGTDIDSYIRLSYFLDDRRSVNKCIRLKNIGVHPSFAEANIYLHEGACEDSVLNGRSAVGISIKNYIYELSSKLFTNYTFILL